MTETTASRNPFAVRDFRLLWIGEAVSSIGDQFAFIALPWLALVLTGSPLALGSVLALMAIPRALLMLIGGVSVDRLSPRRVMLAANAVRLVAVAILGAIVVTGAAQLWMLYVFALVFGIADAFFFPAQTSIVPELVEPELLQRANGIVQGTAQATVLLGPAVAGLVIAALGSQQAIDGSVAGMAAGSVGIGVALLLDAGTFLVSLLTLWLIRPRAHVRNAATSMLADIKAGFRYVLEKRELRAMILLSLSANLLIVGPFEIGVPVIAYNRLPEGAAAFGILMSAFGGGSLIGLAIGAMLPAPRPSRFAVIVFSALAFAGVGLVALPFVRTTLVAALVIGISGIALGYGNLHGMTWVQSRIRPDLMGRVMSVMILGSIGLVPVSMLIAGALVQVSLDGVLVVGGIGMAILCALALTSPTVRRMGLVPKYDADGTVEGAPIGDAAADQKVAGAPA
jgi:MFS family permease